MYTVEYLSIAKNDLIGITKYISSELKNPLVAERFAVEMIDKIEGLSLFPYRNPVYLPIRKLKKEYRRLKIKNYIAFYYVDEQAKLVTVARVIYNRRNISQLLD